MKIKPHYSAISILSAALFALPFAHGKTVSSLDQVPDAIKSAVGQEMYRQQMQGTDAPDVFGSLARGDSAGVTALLRAIAPDLPPARISLLGVRPVPKQKNRYLAVVCAHKEAVDLRYGSEAERHRFLRCHDVSNPKAAMIVALLEKDAGGNWRQAAKPWRENFHFPSGEGADEDAQEQADGSAFWLLNHAETGMIGDMDQPDFAPFRLNDQTTVFGIRFSTQVGYAGGGAFNQSLTLFALLDGKVKPVLTVPVYAFEDLAGEWHKDGTRDHHVSERVWTIRVSRHQTDGFNDLIVQKKGGKPETYRWNAARQAYFLK